MKRLAWVRESKHLTAIIAALHREKIKRSRPPAKPLACAWPSAA